MERKRIYAFDFDGTLTSKDTLIEIIRFNRGTVGLWLTLLLFMPFLVLMKLRLFDNHRTKQWIIRYCFGGWSEERFDRMCADFARANAHIMRQDTMAILQQAQAEGHEVVVVTASIDRWVQPFLPGVHVEGTRMEIKDGHVTGRFTTHNCYGPAKVVRLNEVFSDLSQYHLTAFGDSRGDKEMLEAADEGHNVKLKALPSEHAEEQPLGHLLWMGRASWAFLAVLVALNALLVCHYYDVFTPLQSDYWHLFIRKFAVSGFDPITYSVVSDWMSGYNVYRHPLLAYFMYVPYLINRMLIWLTGINCAIFVMAAMQVAWGYISMMLMYRLLREMVQLAHREALLLTWLFMSFAYVMLSCMVPDHFGLSMMFLLAALYVAGRHINKGTAMGIWQTILLFVLTAGVSLNNGLKVWMTALFANGKRFFSPKFFVVAVILPAALMWGSARVSYKQLVWPRETAMHEAKKKQLAEQRRKEKEIRLQQQKEDSVARANGDTLALMARANEQHREASQKPRRKKEFQGKPIAKGEFMRWTDITTSRWQSGVENLFGESVQLHEDYLLCDLMRSRPMIVSYRHWWQYGAEALLVLLFVGGIWCGRRSRFMWMALSCFALDMMLHVGLGFGLGEVYIMAAHWLFVVPLTIGFLLHRKACRKVTFVLASVLTLYLLIYNVALVVQYLV